MVHAHIKIGSKNRKKILPPTRNRSYSKMTNMSCSPHSPGKSFIVFKTGALACLSAVVMSAVAHANLVVNGGFEVGATQLLPGFGGVAAGGGSTDWIEGLLSSWDVGGSGINALATNQEAYFSPDVGGGPRSGSLAAVLPNFPAFDGYISQQIIGTVAGSIYRVSFWLSNQVGDAANNYLEVRWGGTYVNPSTPIVGGSWIAGSGLPGAIPVSSGWTYYEFLTTADVNDTRLSFIGGNIAGGVLLDDVSVEFVAVPEISSLGGLMGMGLLAFGSTVRLRRRPTAAAIA